MASPCLSSVLTHANLTMYQNSSPDTLQQNQPTMLQNLNTLQTPNPSYISSLTDEWYKHLNPQFWSTDNVLEWISDHTDRIKFDTSHLSLSYCSIDGPTLCQMTQTQMVSLFGPQLGAELHQSLLEHKTKYEIQNLSGTDLSETCQLLDNFLDNLNFPFLSTLKVSEANDDKRDFDFAYSYDLARLAIEPTTPQTESGYMSDGDSLSSNGGMFSMQNPSSPESRSSDSDPEFSYPQIAKEHIKTEKGESRVKRPRGRPPKQNRDHDNSFYNNPKKSKHAPRGTHLWEFIRDILIHPEKNQGLMKWEDRREGVFKFLKSEAVAQMWGQKKKNSSMTYEKLSRAMRYYYKREILERVDGRRLVYKFGKNSSGWQLEQLSMGH